MQIYNNEEYAKKQQNQIKENLFKTVQRPFLKNKTSVIKDYVYYSEPVRID